MAGFGTYVLLLFDCVLQFCQVLASMQVSWVYEWIPRDLVLDPMRLLVLCNTKVEDCLLEVD